MSLAPPSPPETPVVVKMRRCAREIFDYALAECSISRAFAKNLRFNGGQLCIGDNRYELRGLSRVAVVSIGKAGHSMAEALAQTIPAPFTGIISCPTAPSSPVAGFRYFCGGHPPPNEDS